MKRLLLIAVVTLSWGCAAKYWSWEEWYRSQGQNQRQAQQQAQLAQLSLLRTLCYSNPACLAGAAYGATYAPYTVTVTPTGYPSHTLYVYPQAYGSARVCDINVRCFTISR